MKQRRMKKVLITVTQTADHMCWVEPDITSDEILMKLEIDSDLTDLLEDADIDIDISSAESTRDWLVSEDKLALTRKDGLISLDDLVDETGEKIQPTSDITVPEYGKDELNPAEQMILFEKQ